MGYIIGQPHSVHSTKTNSSPVLLHHFILTYHSSPAQTYLYSHARKLRSCTNLCMNTPPPPSTLIS